ncbi:hypothetical protein ACJJI4_20165 [Microbulbifer sp. TRSA002]|uniref:hypothetical protein n=1 Tax=Microbulbifer sp. TRSA002 TaxID=3243382 RepID=UPI004039964B
MLAPNIDNYVRNLVHPQNIQTTCYVPKSIREYAQDFQNNSNSNSKWYHKRSSDGLTRIDQLVSQAVQIQTNDYGRITRVAKVLVETLYTWLTGFDPSTPTKLLDSDGITRRKDAVLALLGGAYCWYRQASEAFSSERRAISNIEAHLDVPFSLFNYRFSRSGFNLHTVTTLLYRGDTRPPQKLWQAGGFFPWMNQNGRFDPHLGTGASNQVISTTTNANIVARFAWHNKTYCPKRYYFVHGTNEGDLATTGFIYELDKRNHQCVEVSTVTQGHEVAFMAIPNQFIRRFRMRYFAGTQNNIELSDWMSYDSNTIRNLNVVEDKRRWEAAKKNWNEFF